MLHKEQSRRGGFVIKFLLCVCETANFCIPTVETIMNRERNRFLRILLRSIVKIDARFKFPTDFDATNILHRGDGSINLRLITRL